MKLCIADVEHRGADSAWRLYMKRRTDDGGSFFRFVLFWALDFGRRKNVPVKQSMAVPAMVFQYRWILRRMLLLFAAAAVLTGCGAEVYEAAGSVKEFVPDSGYESISAEQSAAGSGRKDSSGTAIGDSGTESDSVHSRGTGADLSNASDPEDAESASTDTIRVYVCGCVVSSGVYELPAGARIETAILAAGGLTEDADETQVNQAGHLTDGMQITVPEKGTGTAVSPVMEEGTGAAGTSNQSPGAEGEAKVNLNTATAEELTALNGIGESRAADIIAYRDENGPFQTIEEIMKVSGIKNALFEKIKDHITV